MPSIQAHLAADEGLRLLVGFFEKQLCLFPFAGLIVDRAQELHFAAPLFHVIGRREFYVLNDHLASVARIGRQRIARRLNQLEFFAIECIDYV